MSLPSISRRSLLTTAAAAAPLTVFGGLQNAHAAEIRRPMATYTETAGLKFVDGSPWEHSDTRCVDFRFTTANVKVFPPSLRVLVPEGYWKAGNTKRYPLLLLLHGGRGMFLDWYNSGNVGEIARGQEVIIAMPDGGAGSFYSNANYPSRRIAGWEDFIIHQVLPFVHQNFRTMGGGHVGIAGLSMGGFGALALGHKYYGHFSSISSYSGPADTFNPFVDLIIWLGPAADHERYLATSNGFGSTWGTAKHAFGQLNQPRLKQMYNPIAHADRYRGKRMFMRAGMGAPADLTALSEMASSVPELQRALPIGENFQENVVLNTNRHLRDVLRAKGIAVDYAELEGYTHDWNNWQLCLRQDLPGIVQRINRPL